MRNVLVVTLVLLAISVSTPAFALRFDRFECHVTDKVVDVVPFDVNRDGRIDLVVSYRRGFYPSAQARIAVFLQTEAGFAAAPQMDLAIPSDGCMFDVADLDLDGTAELVLYRKWQLQALKLCNGGGNWATLLKKGSGAIFPPYDGELPYEHLVTDWHGDGSVVLALPDYGALHLYQVGDSMQLTPLESVDVAVRGRISTEGTMPAGMIDYRINSGLRTPNMFLSNVINGARDLVLAHREEFWFYRNQGGRFAEKGKSFFFPILSADERRRENVGLLSVVDDLDGDGHPEVMLNKFGGSLTSYHSRIQIHRGIDGGFENKAGYVVDFSGYASLIRFWDLDGDGRKEMAIPSADIGIMQLARMLVNQSVRVAYKVFACRGPAGPTMYDNKPAVTRYVTLKVDTDSGIYIVGFGPSFDGDFNGDGRPDLFMAYEKGFGVWRNQGRLKIDEEPFVTYQIDPPLSYRLADLNSDRRSDVLLWNYLDPAKQGTINILLNRP